MANEIIYDGATNWGAGVKLWLCVYFIFVGVVAYYWFYPKRRRFDVVFAWLIVFGMIVLERFFWAFDIKFWFGALLIFGIPAVYFAFLSNQKRFIFALLPLVIFGEAIFEYGYFMNKCAREVGVRIYQPLPAIDGIILAPGSEPEPKLGNLSRRSSCTGDCIHAFASDQIQFVEQKLFGDDEGWSDDRRAEALTELGLSKGLVGWRFEKIPNNDPRCVYRGSAVNLSPDIFSRKSFDLCVRRREIFSFRSTVQIDGVDKSNPMFWSFRSRAIDLASQRTIGELSIFSFKGGLLLRPFLSVLNVSGVSRLHIMCDTHHPLPVILEILGISAVTPVERQL